jgi:hypothetical protein
VARQEVLPQEQLTSSAFEPTKVDLAAFEANPTGLEADHVGDRDKQLTTLDLDDKTDQWGVGIVSDPSDQVLHSAEPVTGAIDQWAPDDIGEMYELKLHFRHRFSRHY